MKENNIILSVNIVAEDAVIVNIICLVATVITILWVNNKTVIQHR